MEKRGCYGWRAKELNAWTAREQRKETFHKKEGTLQLWDTSIIMMTHGGMGQIKRL